MHTYTLDKIAEITGGKRVGTTSSTVLHIATDSRKINQANDTLFVAIKGGRHDGHAYIKEIYNSGIRNFIVSDFNETYKKLDSAGFIIVNDSVEALQKLAAYHRKQFSIPVVAITGSNGKTITKEWLSQCIARQYQVCRSPKSYNSQLGVPLSVWLLNENSEYGIFEAGISMPGEMQRLEKIIQPDFGIITNLGEAHQENFKTLVEKAEEKIKLFVNCSTIYYCADHEIIQKTIAKAFGNKKLVSWSAQNKEATLQVTLKSNSNNTLAEIKGTNFQEIFVIPFSDKASVENALQIINFLLDQSFEPKLIKNLITTLQPVAMRLEQVRGSNNCMIINDTYNSDVNSLSIALDFLKLQPQTNKTLILSDIQQSGFQDKELYHMVSSMIQQANLFRFIGIGKALTQSQAQFKFTNSRFFESTQDFLESGVSENFRSEAILVKGARTFQFEKIVTVLAEKNHTTILEINLNYLIHNLNYFRSLLNPGTKIMVMVKALAYGSGTYEIANLLQHEKVDYLGVAFADEGVQLRQSGINLPIMVMSPAREDFGRIIEYELEPEIYSLSVLKSFIAAANSMQISKYPIHLKIDSGMHRLGFMEPELDELLKTLNTIDSIKIKAVFTHMAASDDQNQDAFTQLQIDTFNRMYNKIVDTVGYKPMRHAMNSAGIERFKEAHFELVRLGIGLHGISSVNANLLPVSSLKTHISQIKDIPAGDTIGYNRRGKAGEGMRIAIIPIGYADGLNRKFGNGTGNVIINNNKIPFVGDICMDMCMVDVTNINCNEGDEVLLFGEGISITELASQIGTIPYEILTNVSSRVKRIYYKD